jgi:hypothetical protein
VHFIRATHRSSNTLIVFKGIAIPSILEAKILRVVIDLELQYKKHIAKTATKVLQSHAIKRLKDAIRARSLIGRNLG